MLLWQLVRPPEAGGLGMPPSEAKRLTIGEAVLYLASESEIKAACSVMNQRASFGKPMTPAEIVESHRQHMRSRRKHFTGSDELTAD